MSKNNSYYYAAAYSGSTRIPGSDCEHRHGRESSAERCCRTHAGGGLTYRVRHECVRSPEQRIAQEVYYSDIRRT